MSETTPQDIKQIRESISGINNRFAKVEKELEDMNAALIGNRYTKKGGVVGMLNEGDIRMDAIESRLSKVEKRSDKNNQYLYWLFGCAGFIAAALISIFIHK